MNLSEYYFQLGLRDGIAQMQKQANTGLGAAIGGGAGALGGAGLTALLAENPQLKDYLVNSLIGGGVGAGLGAGAGMLFNEPDYTREMNYAGEPTEKDILADALLSKDMPVEKEKALNTFYENRARLAGQGSLSPEEEEAVNAFYKNRARLQR